VVIVQFHPELCAGKAVHHGTLQFDFILTLFGQAFLLLMQALSISAPRFSLPHSAPSAANRTLLLDAPHLARRDVPSLASRLAQNAVLHDLFSESFEQVFLRFTVF
jgi:hypothetical protein